MELGKIETEILDILSDGYWPYGSLCDYAEKRLNVEIDEKNMHETLKRLLSEGLAGHIIWNEDGSEKAENSDPEKIDFSNPGHQFFLTEMGANARDANWDRYH